MNGGQTLGNKLLAVHKKPISYFIIIIIIFIYKYSLILS